MSLCVRINPESTVPIENEGTYGAQRVLHKQFEELNYNEEDVNST